MVAVHPIAKSNQKQIERVVSQIRVIEKRLSSDLDKTNVVFWEVDFTDLLLYLAWLEMLLGERPADFYQNAVEWCCGTSKRSWKQ